MEREDALHSSTSGAALLVQHNLHQGAHTVHIYRVWGYIREMLRMLRLPESITGCCKGMHLANTQICTPGSK